MYIDESTNLKEQELGLKWNAIRGEWLGYVDVKDLGIIVDAKHVEIVDLG